MMKRQKPIARFSKKRAAENRKYSALRKQFLENNPECEAQLPGCTGEATEVHHSVGRVGKNLVDVSKFIAVCRSCHVYAELHPIEAKELGLSESRLIKSINQ